jgi:methionyl aminopeptidase
MSIIIKSEQEIELMRRAGRIVATVLDILKSQVKPGMRTEELDIIAAKEVERLGAKPSFKGYRGYPATICVSVNDEIVHGIPGKRVLREGDIVSIDFGAIYLGYHGDAAVTVGLGKVSPKAKELMETTEGALQAGIAAAHARAKLGDVSAAIQQYAESHGFSVIREYTGHAIGREMHEEPQVPNFGIPGQGPVLRKGMTFALEPMVSTGDWHTRLGSNQWTVHTSDGSLAAHFEHTIAITDGEAEALTVL